MVHITGEIHKVNIIINIIDYPGSDNEEELNEMEIPRVSATDTSQICPSFANFSFTTWSLEDDENDDEYNRLNQSISASQVISIITH